MRAIALIAAFSICAIACSSPQVEPFDPDTSGASAAEGDTAKKSGSSTDSAEKAPSNTAAVVTPSTPTTAPAPTQAAPDTTWTGTLAKTEAVAFGGSGFCNYKTHFENVSVRITLSGDGSVKFADVNGNAVEETIGTCSQTPIPENSHDYAFAPAEPTAGSAFSASGAKANAPHAMMQASVSTGADGHATLTWHRDDIGSPFDWTITADVSLSQE